MVITTDIWLAPKVSGYDEIRDFYRRMAEKLNWNPGAGAIGMGQPEVAKGMAEVYKEAAKLDGMPVLQETKMTGQGLAAVQPASQPDARPQAQSQPPASATAAIGSALAGRFGRRKKQDDSGQSASSGTPGSLLEMTSEMSNFSSAAIDASRFEVPAGFKQKESDLRRVR
jgi:hypothetical protein